MKKISLLNKVIFVASLITSLLLLLACIVPYTTSASFSFLSLGVPLLVIFNLFFSFYWLVFERKVLWISFLSLVVGYFVLGSFIQFGNEKETIGENQLKIMSYNAKGFSGFRKSYGNDASLAIVNFINSHNPDIICFQEFDNRKKKSNDFNSYPYRYIDGGFINEEKKVLQAIYSKYPIIDKGLLNFPESSNQAMFVDVGVAIDTIRIYNLHLESFKVRLGSLKRERSDRLFKRLRESFAKQHEQATILKEHLGKTSFFKVVCGDFNNTQFSSAYHLIKGDMEDAFAKKGSGYGKTIDFWYFPLRIDFVLSDPELEVTSYKSFNIGLSDHEPIMATLQLSPDK